MSVQRQEHTTALCACDDRQRLEATPPSQDCDDIAGGAKTGSASEVPSPLFSSNLEEELLPLIKTFLLVKCGRPAGFNYF